MTEGQNVKIIYFLFFLCDILDSSQNIVIYIFDEFLTEADCVISSVSFLDGDPF